MEKHKNKISEVVFTGSASTPSPILPSTLRIKDPPLEDSSFGLTWPICKETSLIHHQDNQHDQNWILYMTPEVHMHTTPWETKMIIMAEHNFTYEMETLATSYIHYFQGIYKVFVL